MDDMDILRNLIRKEVIIEPVTNAPQSKQYLILPEKSGQQSYDLKIRNIPDESIAFKVDTFPAPKAIFQCDNGECKRADFVIVTSTSKSNWIVYIEMKSGNTATTKEIEQQLQGAECLVEYCRAIGRAFWKEPEFLSENDYKQRFVSIKNVLASKKQPTRKSRRTGEHDKPERMLKISSPPLQGLQFGKLVEG